MSMEHLSLSSVRKGSVDDFVRSVVGRPRVVVVGENPRTLHYWLEGPVAVGAKIHYAILAGLRRLAWDGEVTRVRDGQFETCLTGSRHSVFAAFRGVHEYRPFDDGRVLLRDRIEFDAPGAVRGDIRRSWLGEDLSAGASSEARTGEMALLDSETA